MPAGNFYLRFRQEQAKTWSQWLLNGIFGPDQGPTNAGRKSVA